MGTSYISGSHQKRWTPSSGSNRLEPRLIKLGVETRASLKAVSVQAHWMSEQNREARDLELRYQRSLRTIRAGLDPAPRVHHNPVIEIASSSTWSTADISTDSQSEGGAPVQPAVSSDSDQSEQHLRVPVPRAKALVRLVPLPKPKHKPQARAKQRA